MYGLIPEFIGRLPVIGTLHRLDEPTLRAILTKPANALVPQYQKLMRLVDEVELVFTEDALTEIAHMALERKTGARALRTIIEEIMLDIMFDIPTRRDVARCIVEAESVRERKAPRLELRDDSEPQQKTA